MSAFSIVPDAPTRRAFFAGAGLRAGAVAMGLMAGNRAVAAPAGPLPRGGPYVHPDPGAAGRIEARRARVGRGAPPRRATRRDAGARERANVDLTNELVELITAQRNFQANAKAIETNNTLTQAIINIRG